jgi:hypothetical protein
MPERQAGQSFISPYVEVDGKPLPGAGAWLSRYRKFSTSMMSVSLVSIWV